MRGVWIKKDEDQEEETFDVAVKMLKEGSDLSSTVKFLREAAIMGQFSHPSVIKLYGVVTLGEPVSLSWPWSIRGYNV